MSPPRILFYTHGLVDGGAERLWANLATAFHQRGHDVLFAVDFAAEENRASLDPAIPLHVLGGSHRASVGALARLIRAERPAVALSAVGGSNLKLLAALSLARTGTRAILSYHGFEEWRTGKLSFAAYATLPLVTRLAARTVAASGPLRDALVGRWRAAPLRTVAIDNPVAFPADTRLPSAAELAARPEVVLSVGRLSPLKDHATLLSAFTLLARPSARLVILGQGPERPALAELARRLGIADRLEMPGYIPDPWPAYAGARCFVLPSRSEAFGNVVVEALAHGLPVVATDCAGPASILDGGRHGTLVPVGDDRALAHAIAAALDRPGDPGPRRARAEAFSIDRRVPEYEALVTEVLTERRRASDAAASDLPMASGRADRAR